MNQRILICLAIFMTLALATGIYLLEPVEPLTTYPLGCQDCSANLTEDINVKGMFQKYSRTSRIVYFTLFLMMFYLLFTFISHHINFSRMQQYLTFKQKIIIISLLKRKK